MSESGPDPQFRCVGRFRWGTVAVSIATAALLGWMLSTWQVNPVVLGEWSGTTGSTALVDVAQVDPAWQGAQVEIVDSHGVSQARIAEVRPPDPPQSGTVVLRLATGGVEPDHRGVVTIRLPEQTMIATLVEG